MTQELAVQPVVIPPLDPELVAQLMLDGNLKGLSDQQRVNYYQYRCELLGLDPATQPFELINLQGKLVLYAKKECANQLASKHQLSTIVVSQGIQGDLYVVQSRCMDPAGRGTDDLGAVSIKGLAGEALCNALLKAVTKAKRRAILGHCGLGMIDETELPRQGWGDSGSRDAAQAVATRKLEELAQGAGAEFVTVEGEPAKEVFTLKEYSEGAGLARKDQRSADERDCADEPMGGWQGAGGRGDHYQEVGMDHNFRGPAVDIPEDPIPESKPKKAKPGTTSNWKFLEAVKPLKAIISECCTYPKPLDAYYNCLSSIPSGAVGGFRHANEITDPETQKVFYRKLQSEALFWEVRKAGGALYDEEGWTLQMGNTCYQAVKKLNKPPSHADDLWREAKRDGRHTPDSFIAWLLDAAKGKGK